MRFDGEGLKQRRMDKNLSIEKIADEAGVAARQWSDWEGGKTPSFGSIKKLIAYFKCDSKDLHLAGEHPKLISGNAQVKEVNHGIVASAQDCLYVTGSRSHDEDYLSAIERAVADRPALIHRRVLFGLPEHDVMKRHVQELLKIRDTKQHHVKGSRSLVVVHQEIDGERFPPEACICMNEHMALFVLPSIHGLYTYDTAVLFEDPQVVKGWKTWIEALITSANQKLHSGEALPWTEV